MNSEAYPAFLVYKYKNIKIKVIKASHDIEFNKKCLRMGLTPKYAVVRINNKSRAAQTAKNSAEKIWVKKEIDHLYTKKIRLNSELYRIHLKLLNELHPAICDSVLNIVEQQIQRFRYKTLVTHNRKIHALQQKQSNAVNTVCNHIFYKRVANLTDINLTFDEEVLLSKGLKYNLPTRNANHLVYEAINAEAAIKFIPNENTQNETRVILNNKLNRLLNINTRSPYLKRKYHNDYLVIRDLRRKLNNNNIILVKADKGNTVVLLHQHIYINKVQDFIANNNIETLSNDPTKGYVKCLNVAINKCKNLFDENTRHAVL